MSLQIGKYISWALSRDEAVQAVVSGRVYPVVAPEDGTAKAPYITFALDGLTEGETKDGIYGDTATEQIAVFAHTLDECEELADLVRAAMENAFKDWQDVDGAPFGVCEQTFGAGAEDFDLAHRGYFVTLHYEIETSR